MNKRKTVLFTKLLVSFSDDIKLICLENDISFLHSLQFPYATFDITISDQHRVRRADMLLLYQLYVQRVLSLNGVILYICISLTADYTSSQILTWVKNNQKYYLFYTPVALKCGHSPENWYDV